MKKMFTVLRARCYWMTAILLCCIPLTMTGQVVAYASSGQQRDNVSRDKGENRRSLRDVLNDLQTHYDIAFVYELEVVDGKEVSGIIDYNRNAGKTIEELLQPLGLTFKKINSRTYAIAREKEKTSFFLKRTSEERDKDPVTRNAQVISPASTESALVSAVLAVTGVVSDENRQPLPGVNVIVKGSSLGTTTDAEGTYNIEVPDGESILVFTFIGYQTIEERVGGRTRVDVSMSPDVKYLDEVAVIGYGTVKKSDLTGSLSQIKSQELNSFPTTNVIQALSGRAPGVQVIQSTGAPGAGVNVRIRGTNSIQGDNEPLYVIDGFPFSGNPTNLNNSEIESIEVLKDASATAIYGSRGANGVVLITTKRGKAGQTKVDFETSYSIQKLRKKLDLMNGSEYATLANIQAVNENKAPYFTQEQIDAFGEGFDWQDLVFQDAPMQNTSLNIAGGSDKTTFNIGGVIFSRMASSRVVTTIGTHSAPTSIIKSAKNSA